jgi:hypothetical protein
MAKHLDDQVTAFRNRPLDTGPYAFVRLDALPQKVREGGRIINVHALVAVGVNADGHREILGIDVATAEDGAGRLAFPRSLTDRGPSGVQLVVPDAHTGLVAAIGAVLPGASRQRCRTLPHALNGRQGTPVARKLLSQVPKSAQPWVATLLRTVFEQSAGTAEQGDPPPHRRGRHLPRPHRPDPPGRRGAGRAGRRVDRGPPPHGPRTPRQSPPPPDRVKDRPDRPAHRTQRTASKRDHRVAVDTPLPRT